MTQRRARSSAQRSLLEREVFGAALERNKRRRHDLSLALHSFGGSLLERETFAPQSFDPLHELCTRSFELGNVEFCPDGSLLALTGCGGVIEIHEFAAALARDETRRLQLHCGGIPGFSPTDCKFLAGFEDHLLVSFGASPSLWIFNLEHCELDRPDRVIKATAGTMYLENFRENLILQGDTRDQVRLFDLRDGQARPSTVLDAHVLGDSQRIRAISSSHSSNGNVLCALYDQEASTVVAADVRKLSSSPAHLNPTLVKRCKLGTSQADALQYVPGSLSDTAVLLGDGSELLLDAELRANAVQLDGSTGCGNSETDDSEARSRQPVERDAVARSARRPRPRLAPFWVSRSWEVPARSRGPENLRQRVIQCRRKGSIRCDAGQPSLLGSSFDGGHIEAVNLQALRREARIDLHLPRDAFLTDMASHPHLPYTVCTLSNNTTQVIDHSS